MGGGELDYLNYLEYMVMIMNIRLTGESPHYGKEGEENRDIAPTGGGLHINIPTPPLIRREFNVGTSLDP